MALQGGHPHTEGDDLTLSQLKHEGCGGHEPSTTMGPRQPKVVQPLKPDTDNSNVDAASRSGKGTKASLPVTGRHSAVSKILLYGLGTHHCLTKAKPVNATNGDVRMNRNPSTCSRAQSSQARNHGLKQLLRRLTQCCPWFCATRVLQQHTGILKEALARQYTPT